MKVTLSITHELLHTYIHPNKNLSFTILKRFHTVDKLDIFYNFLRVCITERWFPLRAVLPRRAFPQDSRTFRTNQLCLKTQIEPIFLQKPPVNKI